jgi:hypothetical protein
MSTCVIKNLHETSAKIEPSSLSGHIGRDSKCVGSAWFAMLSTFHCLGVPVATLHVCLDGRGARAIAITGRRDRRRRRRRRREDMREELCKAQQSEKIAPHELASACNKTNTEE